ncbi:peptidoglycan/xylan/chitin deacetylase (PgdA/CDA1 family) [Tumebacillus sp. BK434]|uniref:polysaccharide deacetylase family protein n=1 Tax=Tumebacillus sp. BK434 TaxID=2512169 RepID=UPI00104A40E7|nr:polysaccharide deacetylase family protein [Tumebacillus sp. BK434]TCP53400.1 peptidoglycan/xylan/chitin deacetylase (PgdA/CDA1 family) [Tumebacillus sp. BK434]
MKPKKITYMMIAVLGVLLFAFGCVGLMMEETRSEAKVNQTEKTTVEYSKYPDVDLVTDISEKEKYNMAIHYPHFTNKKLNAEIEAYIADTKKSFLKSVDENREFIKNYAASLYVTLNIYQAAPDTYSIVFSEESYVAGANGMQKAKVFMVDLKKETFIPQTTILKDSKENREQLYTLLREAFRSTDYESVLFEDDLKEWVLLKDHQFAKVYLTEKAVVFKFDKYEVTAGVAGMPEISIPIDKMQSMLTDEWKEKLKVAPPKEEGKVPPQEPVKEEGKPNDHKTPGGKRAALTFDDGPHPKYTLKILELLDQYHAKATFFMLGNRVDFYPEIARKVAEKGHELGNHTWNHKDLSTINLQEGIREIEKTNAIIKKTTGRPATVFRPPYGAINEQVQTATNSPAVLWTVDTLDWKSHNPDKILAIVKENVRDGSIILMHDIHETSAEAVELILKYLDAEGYDVVPVSELL